jgi:hypothetical protein
MIMASPLTITEHNGSTKLIHDHTLTQPLPCAKRAHQHLYSNNPVALQMAFACGTVHHNCSGVSLAKATDDNPLVSGVRDPGTAKIDSYLRTWDGPLSDQTREDLRKNDLNGLDNLLYLIGLDNLTHVR